MWMIEVSFTIAFFIEVTSWSAVIGQQTDEVEGVRMSSGANEEEVHPVQEVESGCCELLGGGAVTIAGGVGFPRFGSAWFESMSEIGHR
jgi:hypothetical protein